MSAENNVTSFPPTGLATTNAEVAADLCRLAARIEAGEFGKVSNTVTVIDGTPVIACWATGRRITCATLTGLLTMAVHRVCWKDGADQIQSGAARAAEPRDPVQATVEPIKRPER